MDIEMSSTSDEDPLANSNFQAILTTALANYTKQTGNDLLRHPLASKLQTCNSPDSVLVLLQEQAQAFNEFRNGNKRLMTYLTPIVHGLHALSTNAALNKVTALVSTSPDLPRYCSIDQFSLRCSNQQIWSFQVSPCFSWCALPLRSLDVHSQCLRLLGCKER
jgi:fungal STAND N-terminal Goodbye domain